jgi:protein-S-isoprenylcysteine O-methyltransferase Ste14
MTLFLAKLIWALGVVGWFAIRFRHQRRSRKTPKVRRADRVREALLLSVSIGGMLVLPLTYTLTNQPKFANYTFVPALGWLGAAVFAFALWLFYRTHHDLGRNWSVTLEIREQHKLITTGIYSRLRHPMYSAFWMWALAQALLLPNWVAGPAGLIGFGTLFFFRIGREERLMTEMFGDEYRRYVERTSRIIPGVF